MKAINILWDTNKDKELLKELPTEIEIPEEILKDCEDEDEIEETVSDYISDETGFCHFGFELDID